MRSAPASRPTVDCRGRPSRSFAPERAQEGDERLRRRGRTHPYAPGRREAALIVAAWSEGSRDRLRGVLNEHGLKKTEPVGSLGQALGLPSGTVALAVLGLEEGFSAGDLAVIGEQDILGDRLVRSRKKQRRAQNFLQEVASLAPGDFVVHVDHGIGRFVGLQDHRRRTGAARLSGTALRRWRQAVPAGRESRAPLALRLGGYRVAARPARRGRVAGPQGPDEEPHSRDRAWAHQDRSREER